jgi:hypothetical protein
MTYAAVFQIIEPGGKCSVGQSVMTYRPLVRCDKPRPVVPTPGGSGRLDDPLLGRLTLQLSKNIRCFSNKRRLPSSALSIDSAISERWPVSSAYLTLTRVLSATHGFAGSPPGQLHLYLLGSFRGHGRGQARIIVEVEARACPLRQVQKTYGCVGVLPYLPPE